MYEPIDEPTIEDINWSIEPETSLMNEILKTGGALSDNVSRTPDPPKIPKRKPHKSKDNNYEEINPKRTNASWDDKKNHKIMIDSSLDD